MQDMYKPKERKKIVQNPGSYMREEYQTKAEIHIDRMGKKNSATL